MQVAGLSLEMNFLERVGWGRYHSYDTRDEGILDSIAKINFARYNSIMKSDKFLKETLEKLHQDTFRIQVEVLTDGKLPTKAHPTDAGWDLYASEDISLYPGQVLKHPLNIKLALPKGTWAEITTKSGLGVKGHLVYAGVIDEAYRGIPHAVMTNVLHTLPNGMTNRVPIVILKGQKVAQLIMNPHNPEYFMEQVETVDTNTDRGSGGFGSSGLT